MMQADAHRADESDKKHASSHDEHDQPAAAGGLVPEGAE
jgi:hypothetical protein